MPFVTPTGLQDLLFFVPLFGIFGIFYYWIAFSSKVWTIGRYLALMLAQALTGGLFLIVLVRYGSNLTWQGLVQYWKHGVWMLPDTGRIVCLLSAVAVISPLLTLLIGIRIRVQNPSERYKLSKDAKVFGYVPMGLDSSSSSRPEG